MNRDLCPSLKYLAHGRKVFQPDSGYKEEFFPNLLEEVR
jgi:hypothetical protein